MIIDIIKHLIPAEITDKGGASIQLVNKKTIALSTTIKEAKEGLYTLGDAQFIQGTFEGLIKSMAKGVERDGHSRQLGDFLTLYAQPLGPIDIDKGWDESKNMMVLKARLLNRMVLNTRDWTFNDVTPGKDTFVIDYITTGEKGGGVTLGNRVHVNGRDFPAVDKLTVEWIVEGTDKHGVVPTSYMLGSCDRIDIDAEALEELKSAEYDGKTITFTVRGNFFKASKSATLKYVAPPEPTLTKVVDAAHEDSPETTWDANAEEGFMFGSGLMTVRELGILKYSEEYPEGEEFTGMIDGSRTDSKLKFELAEPIGSGWTKLVFYAQDLAGHRSEVTLEA